MKQPKISLNHPFPFKEYEEYSITTTSRSVQGVILYHPWSQRQSQITCCECDKRWVLAVLGSRDTYPPPFCSLDGLYPTTVFLLRFFALITPFMPYLVPASLQIQGGNGSRLPLFCLGKKRGHMSTEMLLIIFNFRCHNPVVLLLQSPEMRYVALAGVAYFPISL